MAFSFVVEDGTAEPDATSYVDLGYADDYVEANTHQSTEWAALDDDTKERLLVRSSKQLDVRFRWNGQRVDQDSGLKWPRCGVYDEDGFLIADNVIPRQLKDAVVEFAVYLMNDDWTAPRDADQYREVQLDVLDIKYNTDYHRAYIPDTIVAMLADLGLSNTGNRPNFKPIRRA